MNTFQKVIKYLAMAFAILLTVGIITAIVGFVSAIIFAVDSNYEEGVDYGMDFSNVEQLDIVNRYGKLRLTSGSNFKVEDSNVSKDFKAEVINGTVIIKDKNISWLDFGIFKRDSSITVYVPENFLAEKIKIDSGAGQVTLENLNTKQLIIDAGVGNIKGLNLYAESVEINGGVGNLDFTDVNFTDVKFDSGLGKLYMDGIILGNSEFECGIGSISLKIKGKRQDYAFKIESGIGAVRINGEKISSEYKDNYEAIHTMKVNGGIGKVSIDFY